MGTEASLQHGKIVKMPLMNIENELDRWILAETYQNLATVNSYLAKFEVEPATRYLMSFMDKLTNWYLRRSRRRFRAAGMGADKQQAYYTLFEVIKLYTLMAAPFAPFVTETVWQQMQAFIATANTDVPTSVHLEYWPMNGEQYIDDQLIEEIATVRKIIKGAMYVRAKHQIKVKQPLKKLSFKL